MKKIILIFITLSAFLILNTCALEIANVIGPDGGYVFYDKGNYSHGWRYILCSPYDFGELKDTDPESIKAALKLCNENSADWHKFGWELPTEAMLKKMLECFSYGLTKFSDDYYYLSVNNLYDAGRYWVCNDASCSGGVINKGKYCSNCGKPIPSENNWVIDNNDPPNPDFLTDPAISTNWKGVILHKNFDKAMNGVVEKADSASVIRIRPIRRF